MKYARNRNTTTSSTRSPCRSVGCH
jgi:hypothetical protein